MVEHVVDTPLHEPDDEFVGGAPRLHEEFAGSCAISSADESAGTDEDLERVLFSVESRHEEVVVEVEHDDELRSALIEANIKGKIESVRWARKTERLYREREREIRADIF